MKVHVGRNHKVQQAAEILREDLEESLNLSEQSDEREEDISSVNADISSILEGVRKSAIFSAKKVSSHRKG